MKKAIDQLINKRREIYVAEGFVAEVIRDSSDNIVAADVTFGGLTRTITTNLQSLYKKDMVEIQIPFGDLSRATIVNRSRVYGDFNHFTLGDNTG